MSILPQQQLNRKITASSAAVGVARKIILQTILAPNTQTPQGSLQKCYSPLVNLIEGLLVTGLR